MKVFIKFPVLLLVMLFLCVAVVLGEDVFPAGTPEASSIIPAWLLLTIKCVEGILAAVLTFFIGWLVKKTGEGTAERQAIEALRDGVVQTYHTLYKQLKEASADGKLTESEKKALRDNAITQAKELAKGPALSVLNAWGKPRLEALVERMVAKMKGKGSTEGV